MRHQSALIKRLLVPQTHGARMHMCTLQLCGSMWLVNNRTSHRRSGNSSLGFLSGERLWKLLLTDDLNRLLSVELSINLSHSPQTGPPSAALSSDYGAGHRGPGAALSLVWLIRALLWVKLRILQRRADELRAVPSLRCSGAG